MSCAVLPRVCCLVRVSTLHCKHLLQSLAVLHDRSSHAESPLPYFGLRKHLCVWIGRPVCRHISSPNIRVPESWLDRLCLGNRDLRITLPPPPVFLPQHLRESLMCSVKGQAFHKAPGIRATSSPLRLFYFGCNCSKVFLCIKRRKSVRSFRPAMSAQSLCNY